ncbi:MAG: SDR family oxidoreductase [Alicyclobacillus macrosporangiidus]|uniref:SDR family oxidoreductase n=1 Tax=Alicyclobacillus macrosporangiidus TaxID=392015 RepID=UPI0026EC0FB8|nr:SDR family oxidoreductase [Alicyclobacillus macrosporangiidus]MCL6598672.1 SDR family oxidoreductase [Alicyclobacillus macrosporangiidus]
MSDTMTPQGQPAAPTDTVVQRHASPHPAPQAGRPWVLVTGATSGIGLATAILCALEGYQVIATGRSPEKLERIDKAADQARVTIHCVLADVADETSVGRLKDEVLALTDGYGVDLLVNNAGYAEAGAVEEIPLERLRRQFETNVFGLVSVTQAFLPQMRQRGRGKIVNVSSVLGRFTIPLLGAYSASKHAVESLSAAMRVELAGSGVDVIVIAPGSVKTSFGDTLIRQVRQWLPADSPYRSAYEKFLRDRQQDRGVHPSVIAKTIVQAIRAPKPLPRYAVPMEAKLVPVLNAAIPTRTLDRVLSRVILGRRSR